LEIDELQYLFEYNVQKCMPKAPMQKSVRVINEVLDFYAFAPEGTRFHVRIIIKSYARERACMVSFV